MAYLKTLFYKLTTFTLIDDYFKRKNKALKNALCNRQHELWGLIKFLPCERYTQNLFYTQSAGLFKTIFSVHIIPNLTGSWEHRFSFTLSVCSDRFWVAAANRIEKKEQNRQINKLLPAEWIMMKWNIRKYTRFFRFIRCMCAEEYTLNVEHAIVWRVC